MEERSMRKLLLYRSDIYGPHILIINPQKCPRSQAYSSHSPPDTRRLARDFTEVVDEKSAEPAADQ